MSFTQLALGGLTALAAAVAVVVPLALCRRASRRSAAPLPPPPEGSRLWMPELHRDAPTSPDVASMQAPPKPWDTLDREVGRADPIRRAVNTEQRRAAS